MMHNSKRSITILLAAGVTAVIAGLPNLAVAKHRHFVRQFEPELGTYASVPCDPMPACASPYAVFSAGTYVGSDPDPRMRAMLLSDFNRGVNATRGR
jgi:hypothetical protein